jgi:hypothetical protein
MMQMALEMRRNEWHMSVKEAWEAGGERNG